MSRLILLLEDDLEFRDRLAAALSDQGYDVIRVARAAQAMEIIQKTEVDLILLDSLLPDMNGIDFIAQLRYEGSTTPIIFMSAFPALLHDATTFNMLTQELEVAQILTKPFAPEELLLHVGPLLSKPAAREKDFSLQTQPIPKVVLEENYSTLLGEGVRVEEEAAAVEQAPHRTRSKKSRLLSSWDDSAFRTDVEVRPDDDLVRIDLQKIKERVGLAKRIESKGHALKEAHGLARALSRTTEKMAHMRQLSQVTQLLVDFVEDYQNGALRSNDSRWKSLSRILRDVMFAHRESMQETGEREPRRSLARLLVVDDDPSVLISRIETERATLFELIPARSEEEALSRVREGKVDAAIIDIHLRESDSGFQIARRLRTLEGYEALPIAFLTAHANIPNRIEAAHVGASLFLTKPIQHDDFIEAAQQLLVSLEHEEPRILIVDDNNERANTLIRILAQDQLNVSWLDRPGQILEVLEELRPDALLLDVFMSVLGGLDICKMLRATPQWQNMPILLFSEQDELNLRIAAFEAGVDDYISRPIIVEEFFARLHARLERARNQREHTYLDPLTSLMRRRAFLDAFDARLSEAQRLEQEIALCLIGVDHLTQLNNDYGYFGGDQVLTSLGRLLRMSFRTEDLRGRWGGDEFVVAFYGEEVETAALIMERAFEEFRKIEFEDENNLPFLATLSAGIAGFPGDAHDVEGLFFVAGKRLDAAKKSGRDRIRLGDIGT